MQADLVLLNGKIVTMDAAGATVEALAVGGDRIIALGRNNDVDPLVLDTEVIYPARRHDDERERSEAAGRA